MSDRNAASTTNARLAWGIFLACLTVYHAKPWAQMQADAIPAPYVAWSFVRHGTFDLHEYSDALKQYVGSFVVELPDGRWISKFPPGSAWAAVPLIAPAAAIREQPLPPNAMRFYGKLVASVYTAAAAVLLYFACRAVAPAAAGATTVLFAFGTSMWSIASQALWMHGPATFWLCAALYLILVYGEECGARRFVAVGLALGMAVATRPTTIIFAAATCAAVWWRLGLRTAATVVAGLAIPLGCYALYTTAYFGVSLVGGYGAEATRWTGPFMRRLADLLVGTSRGLFVYSPALALVPWGLAALRKGDPPLSSLRRAVLWAWIAATAGTFFLYAKWYGRGGWSFGPRFLCETMPVLCILFALAYTRLVGKTRRRIALALVGVSVLVHFLGVFGNHPAWYERQLKAGVEPALFSLRDTHIEANARFLFEILRTRRLPPTS